MRKIAVSLSKGGVGKTTSAVSLAHGLALRGRKVLLVDGDTQGQARQFLGLEEKDWTLAELLKGSGRGSLERALIPARENLDFLAGGRGLAEATLFIGSQPLKVSKAIDNVLSPVEGLYDYVILDMAPGWDVLSLSILCWARELLCPILMDEASKMGFVEFSERLSDVMEVNSSLQIKYILPTKVDRRTRLSKDVLGEIRDFVTSIGVGAPRLCQSIHTSVKFAESVGHGKTIFEYAPNSPGADEYNALVDFVERGVGV